VPNAPECKIMNIIRTEDFTIESRSCGASTIQTQIKKIKTNEKLLLNATQNECGETNNLK
jgi:hypothetical protein